MAKEVDHKTLINFSKGKYSYRDYLNVKSWFNKIENNQDIKNQLFAQWLELTEAQLEKENQLDHLFEKIQYHILLEEKKEARKISFWNYYNKVAAILLFPILALSLWYFASTSNQTSTKIADGWAEIYAPEGARVEFFLPDSTRGWLNSGSKLRYPVVFDTQRNIELVGEGWFNVKHLENSEFVVHVKDMDIKVLGTEFNVSAYPDDQYTDVILEKGKVEIEGTTGKFHQILSPDEKLSFNHQSRSVSLMNVDADRFSAWKDGYLVIDNEPLEQVVGRLERWYNVEFQLEDEALKRYRFKATFKDEPLEEVLRLIAKTTPIVYSIDKRVEDKNGVLIKKKVIIKLKQ